MTCTVETFYISVTHSPQKSFWNEVLYQVPTSNLRTMGAYHTLLLICISGTLLYRALTGLNNLRFTDTQVCVYNRWIQLHLLSGSDKTGLPGEVLSFCPCLEGWWSWCNEVLTLMKTRKPCSTIKTESPKIKKKHSIHWRGLCSDRCCFSSCLYVFA